MTACPAGSESEAPEVEAWLYRGSGPLAGRQQGRTAEGRIYTGCWPTKLSQPAGARHTDACSSVGRGGTRQPRTSLPQHPRHVCQGLAESTRLATRGRRVIRADNIASVWTRRYRDQEPLSLSFLELQEPQGLSQGHGARGRPTQDTACGVFHAHIMRARTRLRFDNKLFLSNRQHPNVEDERRTLSSCEISLVSPSPELKTTYFQFQGAPVGSSSTSDCTYPICTFSSEYASKCSQ